MYLVQLIFTLMYLVQFHFSKVVTGRFDCGTICQIINFKVPYSLQKLDKVLAMKHLSGIPESRLFDIPRYV